LKIYELIEFESKREDCDTIKIMNKYEHSIVTKHDIHELKELINHLGNKIMTAISDFAAAQAVFNAAIDASITALQADVVALDALIASLKLNNISPEDQASLDAISAHSKSMADNLAALDASAKVPA